MVQTVSGGWSVCKVMVRSSRLPEVVGSDKVCSFLLVHFPHNMGLSSSQ
jgi:hypothetical protein